MINNYNKKIKTRIGQKFSFIVNSLLGHGGKAEEPELFSRMPLKLQYNCLKKKIIWQLILIAAHISVPVTNDF